MLPMDSRTVLVALNDETGKLIKVVAKSMSRFMAYFFIQCNKINGEHSQNEEKTRYSKKLHKKLF
jgi:hypothetical protein